ncbi:MAG: aldo/keto reductase [Pseudomonadota bacterium]
MQVGSARMPTVGLGTWKIAPEDTAGVVCDAIAAGYRQIDSACDYGNEIQTGEGIQAALKAGHCSRDELWVTSKLWNSYHRFEHVQAACERSLSDLNLDYLDLYLIHFPIATQFVPFEERYPPEWVVDDAQPSMVLDAVPLAETWAGMESLITRGLVKEIGVCNYSSSLLRDLMAYSTIKPAMLQIEAHPFLTQEKLIRLAGQYDVAVTAFSPLGALSYVSLDMATSNDTVLNSPPVVAAAARLGRSPAQVVLRWGVQRGTAIIPKTTRPERLRDNLALFDFELTAAEMSAISGLNQNRRFNDPGVFCESAFGTFCPIYE